MFLFLDVQTLKGVEDAEEEEDKGGEESKVQEGQTPRCPKEAAEAPDAEKGHAVLLPLVSGANLPVNHVEHHEAGAGQKTQQRHVGAVVSKHGLLRALHPAPAHSKVQEKQFRFSKLQVLEIWDFGIFPTVGKKGLYPLSICPYLKF